MGNLVVSSQSYSLALLSCLLCVLVVAGPVGASMPVHTPAPPGLQLNFPDFLPPGQDLEDTGFDEQLHSTVLRTPTCGNRTPIAAGMFGPSQDPRKSSAVQTVK